MNLGYEFSNQVFSDLSVEIPWSVTTDFIYHLKEITNLNDINDKEDILDDIFYEILNNEKNINEYFEIIE